MKKKPTYSLLDGGEIDGIQIHPLTAPAHAFLRLQGNILLVEDSKREQDEIHAMGEVLFVLTLSSDQRRQHIKTPAAQWDELVTEFTAGLPDHTITIFAEACAASAAKK